MKMRNKFLAIVVCVMGVACTGQNSNKKTTNKTQKNDLLEYNLNGKVKDFSVLKYKAKDSFAVVLKAGLYTDEYSESSDYGEVISFNLKGYIVSKIKYNNKVLLWKKIITRDSLNNKTELNEFNSVNEIVRKQFFKYNSDGKISMLTEYKKTGSVHGKWIYKYEERKMTRGEYDSNERHIKDLISSYNDKGELIKLESLRYKEKDRMYNYTNSYTYDSKKRTKTMIAKSSPILDFDDNKWVEKYNESGDIIEKILDYKSGWRYEYKYDNYNNWITKIEYSDGFPKYVFEREIHYFK